MKLATKLMTAIDKSWSRKRTGEETHGSLPISRLGIKCPRELWYGFRWAKEVTFPPRMLRLFKRGDREEDVFEKLLHGAGVEFWSLDPATKKQFRVNLRNPHINGNCDGIGKGLPDLDADEHFVGEWKTHNDRSFGKLVKQGVEKAKPAHYVQAQLYMHYFQFNWALYGAVNKNDDHLHFELLEYDVDFAKHYLERGDLVVDSRTPPSRISENPGWWECKFCDYRKICHNGKPMDPSCRTCRNVIPLPTGGWWCGLHDRMLSLDEQRAGCVDHLEIQ